MLGGGGDTLVGGEGDDRLDGGVNPRTGALQSDVMYGGPGNDLYVVVDGLDQINENDFVFA